MVVPSTSKKETEVQRIQIICPRSDLNPGDLAPEPLTLTTPRVAFVIPVDFMSFPKITYYFEFCSGRREW